ncbi:MAG TPA: GntR family transcriptional regulator [Sphingomonas sp.]|nr:GntR family transcriptional regulator [Sphingomonas sp.]
MSTRPERDEAVEDDRRTLLSDRVRNALADAITAGELKPGSPLDEQSLADRHGVSRTPVREALLQLQASGLAETIGRRMVVAQVTTQRVMEMFEAMAEIEAVCVRLATYRMTPLERSNLLQIHDATEAAAANGRFDAYDQLNRDFHETLYRATHNGVLAEQALALRGRLAAFRRVQLRQHGRLDRSRAEHDDLIRAINEGDGETAARRMRAHMLTAARALDAYLKDHN